MDLLVRNIGRLLPMGDRPGEVIEDAALRIESGLVSWVGPESQLAAGPEMPELDAQGAVGVPGFVDPHTHLVWAGVRREEFVAR
ncbi:MAG: imidazolonepropionase, partial [Actinomycetes bacterium]